MKIEPPLCDGICEAACHNMMLDTFLGQRHVHKLLRQVLFDVIMLCSNCVSIRLDSNSSCKANKQHLFIASLTDGCVLAYPFLVTANLAVVHRYFKRYLMLKLVRKCADTILIFC